MTEPTPIASAVHRVQVRPAASIRDAIAVIDQAAIQIALVTDDQGRLLGTVTDGDVRRGLLRGDGLDAPVSQVMRRDYRSLPATATAQQALAIMRREQLRHIPVVDAGGKLLRLFRIEELLATRPVNNPVVLMAGGQGTRLRPLTDDCPKPMLPVGGRPLLEIILSQCIEAGFRQFFISVNYLKQQIQDHFQDGAGWGVEIRYLEESEPLGTAGPLSLLPQRPQAPLVVMNGDVLTRVDLQRLLQFHEEHAPAATLCVRQHATQIPYGVVQTDDLRVLAFEEKPILQHHVSAGIYVLAPHVLDLVPAQTFLDMPDLLQRVMAQQHRVHAFPIHEYWLDVGRPETLAQAHGDWQ